eukprot:scpid58329/ scgid2394/ 
MRSGAARHRPPRAKYQYRVSRCTCCKCSTHSAVHTLLYTLCCTCCAVHSGGPMQRPHLLVPVSAAMVTQPAQPPSAPGQQCSRRSLRCCSRVATASLVINFATFYVWSADNRQTEIRDHSPSPPFP